MKTNMNKILGIVLSALLVSCWGHTSDGNDEAVKKAIEKSLTTPIMIQQMKKSQLSVDMCIWIEQAVYI